MPLGRQNLVPVPEMQTAFESSKATANGLAGGGAMLAPGSLFVDSFAGDIYGLFWVAKSVAERVGTFDTGAVRLQAMDTGKPVIVIW